MMNEQERDARNEARDVATDDWRLRLEHKLDTVNSLLAGSALKPGLIDDHKLIMKAVFGDETANTAGLLRDMKALKTVKTWVTHSLSGAVGALLTAIIWRTIAGRSGM